MKINALYVILAFFKPIIPRSHYSSSYSGLPPRMIAFMQIFEVLACDMGIDLGR